jgi:hypothetical protein
MVSLSEWTIYVKWSGYLTLAFAALTVIAWVFKWGIRFRLVGVTGFMTVLTVGLFALNLGLYARPAIPGAVRYTRVYDTGAAQVVIAVAPDITAEQLEATLRQAAADLYSPGRLAQAETQMTIRARTIVHPVEGVSQPIVLGQVRRSLASRDDPKMAIEVYADRLNQLPNPAV